MPAVTPATGPPPRPYRWAIAGYAVMAYAAFLAVLGYALGFFANVGTPTSIDGPSAPHAAEAIAVDVVLLAAFALQHSVMARPKFKRVWSRLIPAAAERSTYVATASLMLALLMWQWQPIGPSLYRLHALGKVGALVIQAGGWVVVIRSTFLVSHTDLFGLRQAGARVRGARYLPPRFIERGAYRYVRHPLMSGFLIVFWATPQMTVGHLLFSIAASLYIAGGVALEEHDLIKTFGTSYSAYRARVPAFLPHWTRRHRQNIRGDAMSTRRSTTVRYETHATIAQPIGEVFDRLSDIDAYTTWMHRTGLFRRSRRTSGAPVDRGTRYVDATRMGTFAGEVTHCERPTKIGFRESLRWFGSELMEARPAYTLEEIGGTTTVHHVAEGRLFGVMRVMTPLASVLARSERARTIQSLKRSFEAART